MKATTLGVQGRSVSWLIVACANAAVSVAALAAPGSLTIDPVNNLVNGVSTNIGKITATLGDGTGGSTTDRMDGNFALKPNMGYLLNCYEFHWLQVVTKLVPDAGNPKYGGNPLTIPIIDTPSGGYDGQTGEDDKPWYLTAAEEATFNTTAPDFTRNYGIRDTPSVKGAAFATYLCAIEKGTKDICLIAGYTWGSGTLGGPGTLAKLNGTGVPNMGDINSVGTALTNGAFAGWSVSINCDLICVPTPATGVVIAGATLFAARRRRG